MNFCEKCGAPLRPGQKFCERCGAPVSPVSAKQNAQASSAGPGPVEEKKDKGPATVSSAEHERLQKQYDELQSRLKEERRNSKVNVLARLAFTRAHCRQVLQFMQDNALTMLFFYVLAVLLPVLRWYLLIIFALMTYLFPLLSNEKRFRWEQVIDDYLQGKLPRQPREVQRGTSAGRKGQAAMGVKPATDEEFAQQAASTKAAQPGPTPTATGQQTPAAAAQSAGFTWNGEAILGMIATVLGASMYLMTKAQVGSLISQGTAILQSGGLSEATYLNLWGFILLLVGIPAIIGGIIKGAGHHLGGGVLKGLGVALAGGYGIVLSYLFANAAEVAGQAVGGMLTGDTSMSDLESLFQLVKLIPWVAVGLYIVGIIVNSVSNRQR